MTNSDRVHPTLLGLGIDPIQLRQIGAVSAFHADADQLLPLWRRLRAAHDQTGLWPVILGNDTSLDELRDRLGPDGDDAVGDGLRMEIGAVIATLKARQLDFAEEEADEDDEEDESPPRGEAAGLVPHADEAFVLIEEPGWIGLVPASTGYLLPGLLSWGGAANYEIEPAEHVAVLKHWHDRYGAELVGLGSDIIELWVPHPPTDPVTALAVAEEQYWYCPDVVDQGVWTLDALAAIQVPARRWFFWWD